ncbi:MAG: heparin lyase I family protein [Deltaproteobacteria bacterium]|nr:heparin lyase I family protein [Deltaproteobacteria bacterium]
MISKIFFLMVCALLISSCGKGSKSTSDGDTTHPGDSDFVDPCEDVTACQQGDGCCPEGCTGENDDDCICSYTIDISTPAAVFRSTFESGTTEPDVSVGTSPELLALQSGGELVAVENPAPDVCNPSAYVLQATTPSGYTRAEYQSPRFPTLNHGYIYTWREYIPVNFYDDITLSWQARAQWKTWPCGSEQPTDVADQLCGSGGIFNDFDINGHLGTFRFRTLPDCNNVLVSTADFLGKWSTYVIEVYWTQSNDGYYRVFQNGRLVAHETGVKTLYDGFVEGECDLYFAGGIYNTWESDDRERITAYFDDYAIFDLEAGIELGDVCPTCAAQTEVDSACLFDDILPIVDNELIISDFENSCDWNVGTLDSAEKVEGNTSLRWDHELETWLEMTFPAGVSMLDFSNNRSATDSLSFWVHNNLEEPDNSMVLLLYSANPDTDGDDYYSVRVAFDFTGWKQIVVSRSEIGVVRTPLGWDQIDTVMFSIYGWDTVANPERVVHLDDMKFTDTP